MGSGVLEVEAAWGSSSHVYTVSFPGAMHAQEVHDCTP